MNGNWPVFTTKFVSLRSQPIKPWIGLPFIDNLFFQTNIPLGVRKTRFFKSPVFSQQMPTPTTAPNAHTNINWCRSMAQFNSPHHLTTSPPHELRGFQRPPVCRASSPRRARRLRGRGARLVRTPPQAEGRRHRLTGSLLLPLTGPTMVILPRRWATTF